MDYINLYIGSILTFIVHRELVLGSKSFEVRVSIHDDAKFRLVCLTVAPHKILSISQIRSIKFIRYQRCYFWLKCVVFHILFMSFIRVIEKSLLSHIIHSVSVPPNEGNTDLSV